MPQCVQCVMAQWLVGGGTVEGRANSSFLAPSIDIGWRTVHIRDSSSRKGKSPAREGRKATGLPELAGPPKWCWPISISVTPVVLRGGKEMGRAVLMRSKPSSSSGVTGSVGGSLEAISPQRGRYFVFGMALCLLTPLVAIDSLRVAAGSSAGAAIAPGGLGAVAAHNLSVAMTPLLQRALARRIRVAIPPPPVKQSLPGAPDITSVNPDSVSAGGGTAVRITGSNFNGADVVLFGSNPSSSFSVVSPTTIVASAPTNSGSVTVQVETSRGTSVATSGSQLSYLPTAQPPITADGQNLEVAGVPTKFNGVNAYEVATAWGTNNGCGGMESAAQLDALFSTLAPHSMVRFWAFQGDFATDVATHQIDWAPLDRVFYLAAEYHIYLIPVVTDQGGPCDGSHWQDPAWYTGGYKNVYDTAANSDGTGLTPLSYWAYMQDLVNRYKNSPALGMWEPISEAEASTCVAAFQPTNCSGHQTCPDESAAAADLTSFFDNVGGQIHSLDPLHLVEEGLLGGSQCGMVGPYFKTVGASPGIDVLSVHDYYGPTRMGGDPQNGLAARFSQAAALDKPIISGEVGILAGDVPSCVSFAQRSQDMAAKMQAQFAAGSSAFLVWNWVTDPLGPCNYNTGPGDPLLTLLAGSAGVPSGLR
jgi:mannan endo-1,4-beta-mannosidase